MMSQTVLTDLQKDSYWNVVEDCLIEFHQLSNTKARALVTDLKSKVESPPVGMSSDLFYHAEPFDVACDLSGKQLDYAKHWKRYQIISARRGW